ncbi:hypothetical protein DPSP01_008634 [Paraphaeosphaeria sporulosa]
MVALRTAPISATPIRNLYISDISDITVPNDPNVFQQRNITHILILTHDRDRPTPEPYINPFHVPIEDDPTKASSAFSRMCTPRSRPRLPVLSAQK